jgi:tripartite-type tricarboxylate transporter receptor subunit TctC
LVIALRLAALMVAIAPPPGAAAAQDAAASFPNRPIHIVVPFPPGGPSDVGARIITEQMSQDWNVGVVVENRPGGNTTIGAQVVAKAAPDGYTLLMAVSTTAVNVTFYRHLNFDFSRDIAPVAGIGRVPFIFAAHPGFPPKTIPELIAYAKANPGKVNFATQGVGSGPHVAAELFNMMAGVDLVHVPYQNNYVGDLLAGQIPLATSAIPQTIEFIRDGRLHAIAVTSATRSDALPDVPAIGEFVAGYKAVGWYGICTPTGTPASIVAKLESAITAIAADATFKPRLAALGVESMPMSTAQFGAFIGDEIAKWAKVVDFAAIKAD